MHVTCVPVHAGTESVVSPFIPSPGEVSTRMLFPAEEKALPPGFPAVEVQDLDASSPTAEVEDSGATVEIGSPEDAGGVGNSVLAQSATKGNNNPTVALPLLGKDKEVSTWSHMPTTG